MEFSFKQYLEADASVNIDDLLHKTADKDKPDLRMWQGLDPDSIYAFQSKKGVTFIFSHKDQKIWTAKGGVTHGQMARNPDVKYSVYPDDIIDSVPMSTYSNKRWTGSEPLRAGENSSSIWSNESYKSSNSVPSWAKGRFSATLDDREMLSTYALLGRIGKQEDWQNNRDVNLCIFWNYQRHDYEDMKPCMQALHQKGLIDPETVVVTPIHKPHYASDWIGEKSQGAEAQSLDAERRKFWGDMMGKAHAGNLPAAFKQQILGGSKGGHKNPWQSDMEKQKLIRPGQKWWAPTSDHTIYGKPIE